jgi:uncharacterized protein (DUF1499 family)
MAQAALMSPAAARVDGRAGRVAGALAWLAGLLALGCGVTEVLGGLGFRFGWWTYGTGIQMLRSAATTDMAAAALALIALLVAGWAGSRRAMLRAVLALTLAVLVGGPPLMLSRQVGALPRIHDVTTDTANPPAFVAVLPRRKGANSLEVLPEVIAQQKKGYPDIAPALLQVPPAVAFERAEKAARAMGWEIVAAEPAEGRIEATDTSLLFGFKDDVVVRVKAEGAGSRVDARSVSRVGRSDFGVNAKRVRKFIAAL